MEQLTSTLPTRQYELDLLRFLAALAVVFFHYTSRAYGDDNLSPIAYQELSQVTRYGYLGVQLFFIISGYVVLLSAQGKTIRQFLISRVQRLYPAFWVACTLTFLVERLWGTGPNDVLSAPLLYASFNQYLLNMTMLQEFLGSSNIDQAYWSLTIEISFYFIVSLLIAYRLMPHLNLVLGLWLAYALIAQVLQGEGKLFAHLLFPRHAPYFIAGMLFYLLQQKTERAGPRYAMLLVAYLIGIRYDWYAAGGSGHGEVVVGVITALFLIMGLIVFRKIDFGNRAWLAKLGALTYPLYLLHGHIGYVIYHQIGHLVNKYLLLAGLVAAMLLASYLLTTWVEKPLSRLLRTQMERLFFYLDEAVKKNPAQRKSPATQQTLRSY
jgi:peptidoglycan/LPS O-acetylase OafA/YrhL